MCTSAVHLQLVFRYYVYIFKLFTKLSFGLVLHFFRAMSGGFNNFCGFYLSLANLKQVFLGLSILYALALLNPAIVSWAFCANHCKYLGLKRRQFHKSWLIRVILRVLLFSLRIARIFTYYILEGGEDLAKLIMRYNGTWV